MTINEHPTVVGIFPTRTQAESAINELHRFGFTDQHIGYIVRDAGGATHGNVAPEDTPAAHKAVGGAVSGGVVGGILGAASSLLIPGFGPALAGGILITTLGGVAIGAAAGGLIGAFAQLGIPEEEAHYYQNEFAAGRIIVTVHAPGLQREALDILRRNGAYDASTPQDLRGTPENPSYAQVGAAPSPASAYNQPGVHHQPGTYDPNAPGTYNPNAPYDPNDPDVRRPHSPDAPRNPNPPNAY